MPEASLFPPQVTPRVPMQPDLSGFVQEKVLRLCKTATANAERTLELTIPIGGNDLRWLARCLAYGWLEWQLEIV